MKIRQVALAAIALAGSGLALAQTTSPSPPSTTSPSAPSSTPGQSPSSSTQPYNSSSRSSSPSSYTNAKSVKDCMAQLKAQNTGMSHEAMKQTCQNQTNPQ